MTPNPNLYYNWHRYYDPSTGGYLTPDPIGLAGGVNLYLYAGGNPINAVDPDGLFKYYGYWGGWKWTGGFEASWDDLSPQQQKRARTPIDAQDASYMRHDKCYATCRTSRCSVSLSECFNKCDDVLRTDLLKTGPMVSNFNEIRRIIAIGAFIAKPSTQRIYSGLNSSTQQIRTGLLSSIPKILRGLQLSAGSFF